MGMRKLAMFAVYFERGRVVLSTYNLLEQSLTDVSSYESIWEDKASQRSRGESAFAAGTCGRTLASPEQFQVSGLVARIFDGAQEA